ncbi:hypothetical protein [Lysobacter antibioticus]|uniref:hypothetical protein n=1 Tax=Lysobacter antibioticus TaxID=84531 RepID=UPI0011875090|nr:hypothetical protein [Lysobacter antibioticus]
MFYSDGGCRDPSGPVRIGGRVEAIVPSSMEIGCDRQEDGRIAKRRNRIVRNGSIQHRHDPASTGSGADTVFGIALIAANASGLRAADAAI